MDSSAETSEAAFLARRRPQPPETLSSTALQWLGEMPVAVRPRELPALFARIANRLARDWNSHDECRAYLDGLLFDSRQTRRGFPGDVTMELATLTDYFDSHVRPRMQTAWDHIAGRRRE